MSYSSYLRGRAMAFRVTLYLRMSVPLELRRLTVKEPYFMGDLRLISNIRRCSSLLDGSYPLYTSLMISCSVLRTIELLGVVSLAA